MALMKCSECGQIFDGNLKECPNCGCPASECEALASHETLTIDGTITYKYTNSLNEVSA